MSTDSDAIARAVKDYGNSKVEGVERSPRTATDTASTDAAMIEFAAGRRFEHIVLVQATSPLLDAAHLKGGISRYLEGGVDSLLSVVRQRRFIWEEKRNGYAEPINYDPARRPRRQDWEGSFVENGAFYITSRRLLLKSRCRISGTTAVYEMPEDTYFELDEPSDWAVMEALLIQKKGVVTQALRAALKKVRLIVMDVDGVLTDAGMYYSAGGGESKKFNTRDGKGIELARDMSLKTAFLTSEDTPIVEARAKKLKIDYVMQGITDKVAAIKRLAKQSGIPLDSVAYIGDDVNDTGALKMAGFSATPSDGAAENKRIVSYICSRRGGEGCVREICDLIIEAKKR